MTARGWPDLGAKVVLLTAAAAILTLRLTGAVVAATDWPGPFVDWQTYENAVHRLLAGDSIYAASQLSGPYQLVSTLLVGYSYPPASVPLFIPFDSYPVGLAAWITVNLGLLITSLWALVSAAWPRQRVVAISVVLILLAWFPPFRDGVVAANVNVGIAGLIGWVAVGLRGPAAGLAGGLGAVTKVFVGATALASERKLQSALLASAVAVVLVAVTLPLVGFQSWVDFSRAMAGAVPFCQDTNWSIACLIGPLVGERAGIYLGMVVAAVAALTLVFATRPLTMAVLCAVVAMAPAFDLHWHYWTIAFVVGVAAVAEPFRRREVSQPTGP